MKPIKFEWDKNKDKKNQKKHKVSFDEAKTVFFDNNAVEYFDPDHSESEDRFLMFGLSSKLRILSVSYQYIPNSKEDIIRIISARKATKKERNSLL
jgi:hypothetical protein